MIRQLFGSVLLCIGCQCEAITLSVVPTSASFSLGGPASVDIVVSGLTGGETGTLGSFDINLTFDTTLLGYTSTAFGTGLDVSGTGDARGASLLQPNRLEIFEVSFDSTASLVAHQTASFRLATVSFSTLRAGSGALTLGINALSDAAGNAMTAATSGSTLLVTPVPEPASWLLSLAGLAGIAGWVRRRAAG